MRLIVHARARADLDEIFAFSLENWDYEQAASYVRRLTTRISELAVTPAVGRAYDSQDRSYLRTRVGRHYLYYRVDGGAVRVFRVLHERMHPDLHLP